MEEAHEHYHGVDFAERHKSVDQALEQFLSKIRPVGKSRLSTFASLGRTLFEDVKSKVNLPGRSRSTRDGFAIAMTPKRSSKDSKFLIVGDVRIGSTPHITLNPLEATRIATGSLVPAGARSVLMREYSVVRGKYLTTDRFLGNGENILKSGIDIKKGTIVLKRGQRIEAQHVALLAQLGVRKVNVFRKPRVAFFSTGDELVDLKESHGARDTTGARVYDSNRPFIESMISELNSEPVDLGVAADDYDQILRRVVHGLKHDALFVSAGSSVGERDFVEKAVSSIKGIKILSHGVAMRPSSPTGLAIYEGKPVVMLPGFPTSAIVSFFVFGSRAIMRLSGRENTAYPYLRARLLERYEGKRGITHFVRVRVRSVQDGYIATILRPTEAFYSSWIGRANGIAVIDEKSSPVRRGAQVNVFMIAPPN